MKKLPKEIYQQLHGAYFDDNVAFVIELFKLHHEKYQECSLLWLLYGMALHKLFRFAEAEQALNQALVVGHETDNRVIFQELGELHRTQGNYQTAAKWYEKAIVLSSEETQAYIQLAGCHARLGNLQKAGKIYRHATTLKGDPEEAWLNLGGVLLSQERYKEARNCFLCALEIDPEYEDAKLRLQDVEQVLKLLAPL